MRQPHTEMRETDPDTMTELVMLGEGRTKDKLIVPELHQAKGDKLIVPEYIVVTIMV